MPRAAACVAICQPSAMSAIDPNKAPPTISATIIAAVRSTTSIVRFSCPSWSRRGKRARVSTRSVFRYAWALSVLEDIEDFRSKRPGAKWARCAADRPLLKNRFSRCSWGGGSFCRVHEALGGANARIAFSGRRSFPSSAVRGTSSFSAPLHLHPLNERFRMLRLLLHLPRR